MDSYSIVSVRRSPRHDSFNRELAGDLWRRDSDAFAGIASGITDEIGKDQPCNWMRRGLARVRRQGN
jgi:hypothetical protein